MSAVVLFIYGSAVSHQYRSIDSLPTHRVAILFGAQVRPDHSLSPMLADRVDGGIALYQAGKVKKLLMTGDNSTTHYDEVTAMKDYAVSRGIPGADIGLDYAGFNTYDSCYRAKAIFGLSDAILVTQAYHMPRALYTCRHLGVKAAGYAIEDFSKYPNLRYSYTLREWLSDQKTWWNINVLHPGPKFLGDPVHI